MYGKKNIKLKWWKYIRRSSTCIFAVQRDSPMLKYFPLWLNKKKRAIKWEVALPKICTSGETEVSLKQEREESVEDDGH